MAKKSKNDGRTKWRVGGKQTGAGAAGAGGGAGAESGRATGEGCPDKASER